MTVYNTNIARNYGASAGFKTVWSGVRELIQNALDASDAGFPMKLEHGAARDKSGEQALKIITEGTTIDRRAFVLGYSEKQEGARGRHGEGLVVGINALLNLGLRIWIRTGSEVWIPFYQNNNGIEQLYIDIRTGKKHTNNIIIEVKNISKSFCESYQSRVLPLQDDIRQIKGENGFLLLNERFQGQLFVKGLYVCELPDNYTYGYDLSNIELNRDREVASPFSLRWEIRELLSKCLQGGNLKNEEILNIFNKQSGESIAVAEGIEYDNKMSEMVKDIFVDKHGEKAMPAESMTEETKAKDFGFVPVHVSPNMKRILEVCLGSNEERFESVSKDVAWTYGENDLSTHIKNNVSDIQEMIHHTVLGQYKIKVVDFLSPDVRAHWKEEDPLNNKVILISINEIDDLEKGLLAATSQLAILNALEEDSEKSFYEKQLAILAKMVGRNIQWRKDSSRNRN